MADPDRASRAEVCDCPEYRYDVCPVCKCVIAVEVVGDTGAALNLSGRLEAARDKAVELGLPRVGDHFAELAFWARLNRVPEKVEAIRRALIGEAS